jgi:uncharacterized membrane protein
MALTDVNFDREQSKEKFQNMAHKVEDTVNPHIEHHPESVNVGETERNISLLTGAGLVLGGLARRGLSGLVLAGLGALFLERGMSGKCRVYQQMGVSSAKSTRPGVPDNLGTRVEKSIIIDRPRGEVFEFWRDLRNLSHALGFIERVDLLEGNKSHWIARGPAGRKFEWDAQVINEHPNELLAWESLPGAEVQNAGSVRFEPRNDGAATLVRVSLEYNPPGGLIGAIGAWLYSKNVEEQIEKDLLKLKVKLETPSEAHHHA